MESGSSSRRPSYPDRLLNAYQVLTLPKACPAWIIPRERAVHVSMSSSLKGSHPGEPCPRQY